MAPFCKAENIAMTPIQCARRRAARGILVSSKRLEEDNYAKFT